MYKEKYLKYKNKYTALKNSLIGGHETGKKIFPTQEMLQSKERDDYYSKFLIYCRSLKKLNNLWMIIGAGNKDRDLTRFKDNYDIALTADNENIDLTQKELVAFNVNNNFIPRPTDIEIIGGRNLRNKFSKIIYDWSTTKSVLNIFNDLRGYGEQYLQRGGIIYTDHLIGGGHYLKLLKIDAINYQIHTTAQYNSKITRDIFDTQKDIFIRMDGQLLNEGQYIPFTNIAWLFEKMGYDSILKSDVDEYLRNFNTPELYRERITARIREVLPEPTFTVEFLNGNYPNNFREDGSDYIIDHYKITKNF